MDTFHISPVNLFSYNDFWQQSILTQLHNILQMAHLKQKM